MSALSVFEEFAKRVGERQPEAAADLFVETPEFFVPGPSAIPFNGARSTKEEVAEFFRQLWRNLIDSEIEVDHVVDDDPHLVAIGHVTHTAAATGRRFENQFAWHFVVTDEHIEHLQVYDDTYAVVRAMGYSEDAEFAAGAVDAR